MAGQSRMSVGGGGLESSRGPLSTRAPRRSTTRSGFGTGAAEITEVRHPGARFLLVAASFVIVVAGLRAAGPLLRPFLVAVFLSLLSMPLLAAQLRRGVPRFLAVFATVLANLGVVAALLLLVGGSVNAFTESMPKYKERLEQMAAASVGWLEARGLATAELRWLQSREPETPADIEDQVSGEGAELAWPQGSTQPPLPAQPGLVDFGAILDLVGTTLRSVAALLSNILLVVLMMVFILLEAAGLPGKIQSAFGLADTDLGRLDKMKREIQRYLGIKTLISLATGGLIAVWVGALGVDYPLLWGLIAFLFNYIPSLGSILAAIPTVLLTLVEMGLWRAALVGVGYLVVNIVLGNFVEPQLMGRKLGLSTLVVFLSLVFWGFVWGPIGMLLSVPLTMIIKIMFENTEDFRWLGELLGANPRSSGAG